MSKVSITRSLLDDLATSISVKSGEVLPLTLDEMKDAVDGIQTGGGVDGDNLGYGASTAPIVGTAVVGLTTLGGATVGTAKVVEAII